VAATTVVTFEKRQLHSLLVEQRSSTSTTTSWSLHLPLAWSTYLTTLSTYPTNLEHLSHQPGAPIPPTLSTYPPTLITYPPTLSSYPTNLKYLPTNLEHLSHNLDYLPTSPPTWSRARRVGMVSTAGRSLKLPARMKECGLCHRHKQGSAPMRCDKSKSESG
jgi:hypothetical protein